MSEEIIFDNDVETDIHDKCKQFISDLSVLTYDLLGYFDKREGEYKKNIKQLESSLEEMNELIQELAATEEAVTPNQTNQ